MNDDEGELDRGEFWQDKNVLFEEPADLVLLSSTEDIYPILINVI